jgi:hypothetical protein
MIALSQGRHLHRTIQTRKRKHVHASNGILTHDPSVSAGEDIRALARTANQTP